ELDVGRLGTLWVALLEEVQGDLLPLRRQGVEGRVQLFAHRLEDLRPRVVGSVDAVAEAHEALVAREGGAPPLLGVLGTAAPLRKACTGSWLRGRGRRGAPATPCPGAAGGRLRAWWERRLRSRSPARCRA